MSKQYAYLLLKGSISLLIRHLLRQLSPIGLEDLWAKADDLIRASTGHLTQRRHGDPIPALNDDLISLPLREGGLGLTLYTDHNGNLPNATYTAAYAAARPLMEAIGSSRAPRARQSSLTPPRPPLNRPSKTPSKSVYSASRPPSRLNYSAYALKTAVFWGVSGLRPSLQDASYSGQTPKSQRPIGLD